jgi:hypothetical protein
MALFDSKEQMSIEEQAEAQKEPCVCCGEKTNYIVMTYKGSQYSVCEKHRAVILNILYEQTTQILEDVLKNGK